MRQKGQQATTESLLAGLAQPSMQQPTVQKRAVRCSLFHAVLPNGEHEHDLNDLR